MCKAETPQARAWRLALLAVVVAGGIAALLGSGGGFPEANPGECCQAPSATIEPSLRTVSVGEAVAFGARVLFAQAPVSYQWRRNGVDIGGATGATLQLGPVNLADDAAQYTVVVTAANGSTSATAVLQVSAYPPLTFADAEFAPGDWRVAVVAEPASGGSATVTRAEAGGHPGAYRRIDYALSAGPSTVTVFHGQATATHDPATQGPVYAIDAGADCLGQSGGESGVELLLEQGGRRFTAGLGACTIAWFSLARGSLGANDFGLVDGPACPAGTACPDFSAGGAPIRFGFATHARVATDMPARATAQGVDNWRMSVFRR